MNSLLVGPLGHVGLALSTSTVALFNFVLLGFFMRRKLGRLQGRKLSSTLLKVCTVSAAMAAAAWAASAQVESHLPLRGLPLHLAQVAISMSFAAVVFYLGCRFLKVSELDDAIAAVAGPVMRSVRRVSA